MPQPERNTTGLTDAAERRHDRALDRARHAIRRLERTGEAISFQAVAREAAVSRQFLYTVDELRREIERLRAAHLTNDHTAIPVTQRASEASLKARNQMLLDETAGSRARSAGSAMSSPAPGASSAPCDAQAAEPGPKERWQRDRLADS